MKDIKLMKTKRGFGFKVFVNGTWLYTSKVEFFKMLDDKASAVIFREIVNNKEGVSNENK